MAQKPTIDKTWPNMKIYLREAQDDLSSLPISGSLLPNTQQANFTDMTAIVTHRLLQEQASLACHQIQDLYSPTPGSYTASVGNIITPPLAQEPITPTSD